MFAYAQSFNQPLNNWNVSNVKYMTEMFDSALSFNMHENALWYIGKKKMLYCILEIR